MAALRPFAPRSALLALMAALALLVGLASPSHAKRYEDTRHRFSLDMPKKWRLAPIPADTQGMVFRRDVGDVPVTMRVAVRPLKPAETIEQSLADAVRPFSAEIGFKRLERTHVIVGLMTGLKRRFSVFANGDPNTVRVVEIAVLHAFGHVHVLHFDTLARTRRRVTRDHDHFLGTYKPKVGKSVYGPLVGKWTADGAPPLTLSADARFSLGQLAGTFSADGGRLSLHTPDGFERYRYWLRGAALKLESPALKGGQQTYRRAGSQLHRERTPERRKARALTAQDLHGKWRVLDQLASAPLVMQIAPSGSFAFGPMFGRWRYKNGLLTVTSASGQTVTYTLTRDGARLRMGGGDLEQDVLLVRSDAD